MKYAQLTTVKNRQICMGVFDQHDSPDETLGWIPFEGGDVLCHEYIDGNFIPLAQEDIESLFVE